MSSAALLLVMTIIPAADVSKPFAIEVVDEQTGRGVPLIELRTVNNLRFVTDSNGFVAFQEPGMMGQDVYFHVHGHGYQHAADAFDFRGETLRVEPGGRAKLTVKRTNIAERLYRATGAGIYSDSVLLGEKTPLKDPVLNAQVLGSDSVLNTVYRGKLHWFWGDTNRLRYPLGNYHTPGAVSRLPADGGLDPAKGVDLAYFTDAKGFAKPTLKMPGKGPTWMTSLAALKDKDGRERLLASYVKIEGTLRVYARGIAAWNDEKDEFEQVAEIDMKAPIFPQGHTFVHDGYLYFAHPFPLIRTRATAEDFQNLASYESYTCLNEGSTLEKPVFDRDEAGKLRYAWKKNTPPVSQSDQAKHKLPIEETPLRLRDRDTGKTVLAHAGSVYWNEYRKKWILITVQQGGTSLLGEVWYAEANAPDGPWDYAVKVVTHEKYSFYNPKQHPMFDRDGGRFIYFEGTYTHTFSGNPDQTPRYDYNQIMYRLDLADKRLAPARLK